MTGSHTINDGQRWFPFLNSSGEEIPPFSWVALTDATRTTQTEGYRVYAEGEKPTAATTIYALAGPLKTPDGLHGECTTDFPAWMAYDSADGTPANGDFYGPRASAWVGKPGGPYLVVGAAISTETPKRVLVTLSGGGDVAFLRVDTILTSFLGNRNSGGILYEGDAFRVITFDGTTFLPSTLDATAVTINARNFDGLLVPSRTYKCSRVQGKWIPETHGQSHFSKCVASGSGITDTSGEATIYLRDAGSVESIGVECIVPEDAEPIPAGTKCTCFWDSERQVMWAVPHGCPPTSE